MTEPQVTEAMRRVFLAGHSEGWTGNQQRRDVQHHDAEKGWQMFIKNGALAKALAAAVSEAGSFHRALTCKLTDAELDEVEAAMTGRKRAVSEDAARLDDVVRRLADRLTPNPARSVDETAAIIRAALSASPPGERE